jgi:hypothetical protein
LVTCLLVTCLAACTATPLDPDPDRTATAHGDGPIPSYVATTDPSLQVLAGFNVATRTKASERCVEQQANPPSFRVGELAPPMARLAVVRDRARLASELDLDPELDGRAGTPDLGGTAKLLRDVPFRAGAHYLLLWARVHYSVANTSILDLSSKAAGQMPSGPRFDPQPFIADCGHAYADQIRRGAFLYLVYELDGLSDVARVTVHDLAESSKMWSLPPAYPNVRARPEVQQEQEKKQTQWYPDTVKNSFTTLQALLRGARWRVWVAAAGFRFGPGKVEANLDRLQAYYASNSDGSLANEPFGGLPAWVSSARDRQGGTWGADSDVATLGVEFSPYGPLVPRSVSRVAVQRAIVDNAYRFQRSLRVMQRAAQEMRDRKAEIAPGDAGRARFLREFDPAQPDSASARLEAAIQLCLKEAASGRAVACTLKDNRPDSDAWRQVARLLGEYAALTRPAR